MAGYIFLLAALCVSISAAPPASPRLYAQHASTQFQINPLDYYLDNADVGNYYSQAQAKHTNMNSSPNGAPARLETLEPDSEVELIPGAQTPQQPPQQNPVAPNLPGLLPGQRVFIVHMPVPGYRPGTIGGYQPVYIVAAAPQGTQHGFPGNGYQNGILLDQSGQAVLSPVLGFPRAGLAGMPQGGSPGFVLGAAHLSRPYDLVYQDQPTPYSQPAPVGPGGEGSRGALRLAQLVSLQGQHSSAPTNPRPTNETPMNAEPKRLAQLTENVESKETEEPRRNARPTPPHAQIRTKA